MNDLSLESRVIELELQVKEMGRILTMLVPSLRVGQVPSPTLESFLHLKTDPSLVMRMEALSRKHLSGNVIVNET